MPKRLISSTHYVFCLNNDSAELRRFSLPKQHSKYKENPPGSINAGKKNTNSINSKCS